jgi:hypothetical protein
MSRPVIIVRPGHLPETIATVIALLRASLAELAANGFDYYQKDGRLRLSQRFESGERYDRKVKASTAYVLLAELAEWRTVRNGKLVKIDPPRVFGHVRSPTHLSEWCPREPGGPLPLVPLLDAPNFTSPGGAA